MAMMRYTFLLQFFERLRLGPTRKSTHLRSLFKIAGIVVTCVALNAVSFYHFERRHGHDVSAFDAVWFSATTITTVGYGDLSPQTFSARLTTMLLMYLVGIASLPIAIAHFLAYFDVVRELEVAGMSENKKSDCLIIVHVPNTHWVQTLIAEARAEPTLASIPIWVIDPVLERLPESLASLPDVHFIHGNTIDLDTYRRAKVEAARFVIVLPSEPAISDSDAATSTVVRVIRSLTDARIIPVRVDSRNEHLFEGFRGLVPGDFPMKVAAQELTDPFVARGIDNLMSNREGSLPLSLAVNRLAGREVSQFEAMLRAFCESTQTQGELRLLAHVHDGTPNWLPKPDDKLEEGDIMILVGTQRPSAWRSLEEQLLALDEGKA